MQVHWRLGVWSVLAVLVCARAATRPGDINDALTLINSRKPNSSKEPGVEMNETEAPRAVNERFPHAVLFGGTCGGSIISPTWVITAGHCTLFTGGRYILAGTNRSDDNTGVTVRVKRLVIHPRFSVGPYWLDAKRFNIKQVAARWDFLLAELEKPLVLDGKTIAAVKLDNQPSIPAGIDVGYAGYGAKHHGDIMRSEMHGMEMITVADDVCAKLEQYDKQDMLCAKGRPPRFDSACNEPATHTRSPWSCACPWAAVITFHQGDSGSGLVSDGRLLGIASWVENDAFECRNGAIVVFSRVSRVRDWIQQVTGV